MSARHQIVIGALGCVEMAVAKLKARGTVDLSEDKKADVIHDLMMLLVSDSSKRRVVAPSHKSDQSIA